MRSNHLEELAREELSDAEVRQILERLAFEEMNPLPTVGAVSEAAGAPPEVIGRILADIRGISFQQMFAQQQREQDQRLDHHERRLNQHEARLRKQEVRRVRVIYEEIEEVPIKEQEVSLEPGDTGILAPITWVALFGLLVLIVYAIVSGRM